MSYVVNDPADFARESAEGFVAAHADVVRPVRGGVARARTTDAGQVAVVIGGGSGHYPAFAGLVGEGLAHGAAMGDVFASPSARQVYDVARSVAAGAGVLLTYGNYAGDALNFDLAEQRLRDAGIACRTVRVTDDVYSAPPDERHRRRGIAGDLAVFKVAGWAAGEGYDLEHVADLAARANDRTRSLGVAFSGCTLPGAEAPLFDVPEGRMAVGMGIHGEPGLEVRDRPSAHELAGLMVDGLLAERPDDIPGPGGARVAVILNGLGSVKSEELFVIYGTVAELLAGAGATIVGPEVGEFATSFEMAGVSLTLLWLDDELERAWTAPADAPAFHRAAPIAQGDQGPLVEPADQDEVVPTASAASVRAGVVATSMLAAIRDVIDRDVDELGRLDAVAGDGDHGIGMQRGARAAAATAAALEGAAGAGTVLTRAGDAWADRAGGTSGALWGAALRAAGESLGDESAPSAADVVAAVAAGRDRIQTFGRAEVGDKTLVDALVPFATTLASEVGAGEGLGAAWTDAAGAATTAADDTAQLLPRVGRARPHLERSRGTPDPGAVSFALAMTAAAAALDTPRSKESGA